MNKQEIDNLDEIVKLEYRHICLSNLDFIQFTNIPWQAKNFYRCYDKIARFAGKRGFFNGGRTLCWTSGLVLPGHIKISTAQAIHDTEKGWSDIMSFQAEDAPLQIYKFMKLKAFW